jgi:hypothetical protein
METVLLIVSTRPHELCAHQLRGFHTTILVRDIVSSTDHCARPDVVPAHARAVRSENRFLGVPRVSLACSPCLGVVVAAEIPWDRHSLPSAPTRPKKQRARARAFGAQDARDGSTCVAKLLSGERSDPLVFCSDRSGVLIWCETDPKLAVIRANPADF